MITWWIVAFLRSVNILESACWLDINDCSRTKNALIEDVTRIESLKELMTPFNGCPLFVVIVIFSVVIVRGPYCHRYRLVMRLNNVSIFIFSASMETL